MPCGRVSHVYLCFPWAVWKHGHGVESHALNENTTEIPIPRETGRVSKGYPEFLLAVEGGHSTRETVVDLSYLLITTEKKAAITRAIGELKLTTYDSCLRSDFTRIHSASCDGPSVETSWPTEVDSVHGKLWIPKVFLLQSHNLVTNHCRSDPGTDFTG